MDEEKIVVVGGYVGCGKTSWIYQQIASNKRAFPKSQEKILYLKAGNGEAQIEQKIISIDFPTVKVFGDGQEVDFVLCAVYANSKYPNSFLNTPKGDKMFLSHHWCHGVTS